VAHCPNCRATVERAEDVDFAEMGAKMGFIKSSKRFYVASCASCGHTLGSGVAGAEGG
jgi:predicted nucleic-acid-binding Zn-ribbon protein